MAEMYPLALMLPLIPASPCTVIVPEMLLALTVLGELIRRAVLPMSRPPTTNLICELVSTVARIKLPIWPAATLAVVYI